MEVIHGTTQFSGIDSADACLRTSPNPAPESLTNISTSWCPFQYNFLPFRLDVYFEIFQKAIEKTLSGVEALLAYQDDAIILGAKKREDGYNPMGLSEGFPKSDLSFSLLRSVFSNTELKFHDFTVDATSCLPRPAAMNRWLAWRHQRTKST
ncbi:hypothetical protein PHET_10497 [Paragonimus heterotremus]|uniref:Reverse transcriptase domain-containing protein n=1 Tax=Paragonimus heterotremus TaxID=100268 RepID=A0A8J4T7I6_9TREM|nr:hypothetical protein PHET_10497 [Paragonimus heterotremus]